VKRVAVLPVYFSCIKERIKEAPFIALEKIPKYKNLKQRAGIAT
tara:strand:+ start:17915 stop:18046 length:132 start_codon:yes stop_codon:yes gene_type:complete